MLQLSDVDLAHQRGNVLIVFVAGLGFRHHDLRQDRWSQLHDPKTGDIATEFAQTLDRPGAHDGIEVAPGYAIVVLQQLCVFIRVEET